MEFFCKDGTRATLRDVPQEVADFVRFPNMPINNVNTPLPVPFGSMDTEPFNITGSRVILAPCINTDIFLNQYTSGLLVKTYGQPYVFYRSARMWAKVSDYTQASEFFTIDSSKRYTESRPIRKSSTNDVAGWSAVIDGSHSVGATVVNTDNLDLDMRGAPKLGTVSAAVATTIEVKATDPTAYGYIISKTGETNITGSDTGDVSIDISSWDLSNWDFENITIKLDITGAGTVEEVYMALTFNEQETGDRLAYPVFQAISGYEDVAAQYEDGVVINSTNLMLEIPIDVVLALLRDKRTGMRIEVAEIDLTNIVAERAKISTWKFAFSPSGTLDTTALSQVCEQGKIRLYRNFDGKWKFSVFDKEDAPVGAFFHDTNIAVRNADVRNVSDSLSSMRVWQSPMSEILNEWQVSYGWDASIGEYTEVLISSPHYLLTGTGVIDPDAGTLTDASATFVTDGVQVGYKAVVVRDVTYTVDVVTETVLDISPPVGESYGDRTDTYYIGPNTQWDCLRSWQKYKIIQRRVIESRVIQDDTTATNLLTHLVEYWSQRRVMVTFRTWLNACDLELGDFITMDHKDLPPNKQPIHMGKLNNAATKVATTLDMNGTGALLVRADDVLIIRPANGDNYREVLTVVSVDDGTGIVTVTRTAAGTTARAWAAGALVQRVIVKFEVVALKLIPERFEIEITARETPRHYVPVGHAAPDGTPDYASASAVQRASYGWSSYPNGEASWLDEDSSISFART